MIGVGSIQIKMDRFQWSDLYKNARWRIIYHITIIKGEGSKNNRLYSANARSFFCRK